NVVTSNKELVAEKGAELLALARKNNVNFMFEASVAGAIPVIRPLHQCLAANEIQSITGILNGTTNFILTKMIKEKSTFEDALKLAQELGYAESNPTADVEGLDACRKICILASLAYGKQISPNDVTCEGITKITPEDVAYATSWGGVIKLIGSANLRSDNKIDILVAPRFVSLHSRLAGVDDVFNAISVIGDCTGEVVFYGKGAGKMPTGSAVVADIIDCVVKTENIASLYWEESKEPIVSDPFKIVCMMYVRLKYDEVVQLKELQELFSPYRELQRPNQPDDEIAFITPFDTVADHMRKLRFLQIHGVELLGAIRILN
ncbi:MAG: homoserine dehydrogenase, partial [Oscillospiraceae bacterium]